MVHSPVDGDLILIVQVTGDLRRERVVEVGIVSFGSSLPTTTNLDPDSLSNRLKFVKSIAQIFRNASIYRRLRAVGPRSPRRPRKSYDHLRGVGRVGPRGRRGPDVARG